MICTFTAFKCPKFNAQIVKYTETLKVDLTIRDALHAWFAFCTCKL